MGLQVPTRLLRVQLQHYVESCGINLISDPNDLFDFINCTEDLGYGEDDFRKVMGQCITKGNLSDKLSKDLNNCMDSDQWNQFEHQMGLKTEALQPKNTYVPWVVINRQHDETEENKVLQDVFGYVCDHFEGQKAEACSTYKLVGANPIEKCFNERIEEDKEQFLM